MQAIRKWVQSFWFFLTNGYWAFPFTSNLYQGPLKIICSPGLNCYSCPAATTFCPIGSLQQLLMSVRLSFQLGSYYFGSFVLGVMGIFAITFGRFICGWACPFGLIQELLYKIPTKKISVPKFLAIGKYLFLLLFVIVLPLVIVDEFGMGLPWFCKFICPAGTLEAGIPMLLLRPDLRPAIGFLFAFKLVILLAFIIWSIVASRPFCRTTCPLGAFYGLFNRFSFIQLKLDNESCTGCGRCLSVCPVEIQFNLSAGSSECINCLRCLSDGCKDNAIYLSIGGYSFSPQKIKNSTERSLNV